MAAKEEVELLRLVLCGAPLTTVPSWTMAGLGPLCRSRGVAPQCANPRRYRVICESARRSLGDLIIFTSGQSALPDGERIQTPDLTDRLGFGRRRFGPNSRGRRVRGNKTAPRKQVHDDANNPRTKLSLLRRLEGAK